MTVFAANRGRPVQAMIRDAQKSAFYLIPSAHCGEDFLQFGINEGAASQ